MTKGPNQEKLVHAKFVERAEAAKLYGKIVTEFEHRIVRWNQEDLPMPAYLRAEELADALVHLGVLGPSVLERGQGLNDQEAGQAASDSRPPLFNVGGIA